MRRTTIVALTLAAVTAIACSSAGGESDTKGPGAQDEPANAATEQPTREDDGQREVIFEVKGGKKADITYQVMLDQSQDNGAKLPWTKTVKTKEDLIAPTIVAQSSSSSDKAKITCTIKIDGKVVKTNSSKGAFAVVTCTADDLQ